MMWEIFKPSNLIKQGLSVLIRQSVKDVKDEVDNSELHVAESKGLNPCQSAAPNYPKLQITSLLGVSVCPKGIRLDHF